VALRPALSRGLPFAEVEWFDYMFPPIVCCPTFSSSNYSRIAKCPSNTYAIFSASHDLVLSVICCRWATRGHVQRLTNSFGGTNSELQYMRKEWRVFPNGRGVQSFAESVFVGGYFGS
jgi:hypothetical protein